VTQGELDEEGLINFLCGKRSFSRQRVEAVVERIKGAQNQRSLTDWFRGGL